MISQPMSSSISVFGLVVRLEQGKRTPEIRHVVSQDEP